MTDARRMTRRGHVARRSVLASALGAVALAACTEGGSGTGQSDGGGTGSGSGATTPPPDPSAPVQTTSMRYGPSEITIGVRPLARHESSVVLTLDLAIADAEPDLIGLFEADLGLAWGSDTGPWTGIRLLDLDGDQVAVPAVEASGRVLWTGQLEEPAPAEETTTGHLPLVFGDLGLDEVALYLPKVPLLTGLPVLDLEPQDLGEPAEPLELDAVASALITPMVSLSSDLELPLREQEDQESTTVDIGADVLFDSSSSTLSEDSDRLLETAAAQIAEHEPGPVTVIGHTDPVDEEEFNLDLSRRRAEAVAEALASLIDTAQHPLETDGRGESEPVADNSTDEGRTRNRRVELRISTPRREEAPAAPSADPAPFDGPSATGEEGLLLEEKAPRSAHLRATAARIEQGHLVVTLDALVDDEEVDSVYGLNGLHTAIDPRSDLLTQHTDGGLAVLSGSALIAPVHHLIAEDGVLASLADLYTPSRIDGGAPRVLELVYPRDIPGIAPGGTLTLQHGREGGSSAFRLTDIPIAG